MAPRRRFERPTYRLGGGCSIQLSYRGRRVIIGYLLNNEKGGFSQGYILFVYNTHSIFFAIILQMNV